MIKVFKCNSEIPAGFTGTFSIIRYPQTLYCYFRGRPHGIDNPAVEFENGACEYYVMGNKFKHTNF